MSWLRERWGSFGYAARGVLLLSAEPNARIHAVAAVIVVVLGAWLGLPRHDWALLFLAMGLVFGAEALNTAFEALADRVAPDEHALVARSKDLAAGGVLLAAIAAAAMGLLVLGPPLLERLAGR